MNNKSKMMQIKSTVEVILEQQTRIAQLLGFLDGPKCRPPVSDEKLEQVNVRLTEIGLELPGSYKTFIKCCDGIENVSSSYDLFGSTEFLSDHYVEMLHTALEQGIGYDFDPDLPPLLIGDSSESRSKVFFEYRHERQIDDEPIVLEGEPGFLTLHYSFFDFLECRVEANKKTFDTLMRARDEAEFQ